MTAARNERREKRYTCGKGRRKKERWDEVEEEEEEEEKNTQNSAGQRCSSYCAWLLGVAGVESPAACASGRQLWGG